MLRSSASVMSIHSLNSRGSRKTAGRDGGPRQRKFNLDEVIEGAFELIVGEYGTKANLEIPIGFYETYNGALMRNFLASAIFYFYAYIRVLQLAHTHRDVAAGRAEGALRRKDSINFAAHPDLLEARRDQKIRLERLARAYARVLLSCSNYEHTHEDVLLFECIYQFAFLVLKTSVDPGPFEARALWTRILGELCYIFRGPNFDIESKRSLKQEMERKAREIDRLKSEDAQGADPSLIAQENPLLQAANSLPGPYSSARSRPSIASSSRNSRIWHRGSKLNASGRSSLSHTLNNNGHDQANKPEIKIPLPDNMYLNIASFDITQRPEKPATRGRDGSPRKMAHNLRSPEYALLGGSENLALRARDQKKAFSVHKAMHARSPILAMILPDPLERTRRNAQAALAKATHSSGRKKPRRRRSYGNFEGGEDTEDEEVNACEVTQTVPCCGTLNSTSSRARGGVLGGETARLLRVLKGPESAQD